MKKIAVFLALGLFAASFTACGSPAEVHVKEKGQGALIGATPSSEDSDDGNSRLMIVD